MLRRFSLWKILLVNQSSAMQEKKNQTVQACLQKADFSFPADVGRTMPQKGAKRMDYMVVYSSRTGNTKKIATEIFAALPGMSKDMQSIEEYRGKDADTFLVGFWTDRGSCDMNVIDLLSGLHGKKVALFGTCGMGDDETYYRSIEQRVSVWVPDDCEYLGAFLCQGKMPMQVRERYELFREDPKEDAWRKRMLRNFDQALLHPNEEDLDLARKFIEKII